MHHILRYLHRPLSVAQSFLMPIQLAQQSTHLHVYLTFILQSFQLPRGVRLEQSVDMWRREL